MDAQGISVRLEHCPNCGATDCENIFVISAGKPVRVYVRCKKCGSFVARYTLARYTSDKPYESLLSALRSPRCSGRGLAKELEAFTHEVEEEFQQVLELLRAGEDQRKIEEIIHQKHEGTSE